MCSPRHSVSARFSASKKNTRSRSARDGTSPYRPYAAASSSVRKLHRHTPQGQDRPASNQHTATEPLQTPRHRRPARDETLNGGESARASSLTPQAVPLLLEPRQPRSPPATWSYRSAWPRRVTVEKSIDSRQTRVAELAAKGVPGQARTAHAQRRRGAFRQMPHVQRADCQLAVKGATDAVMGSASRTARSRRSGPADRCHTHPEVLIRVRLL
jgi:hypothetical protein